MESVWNTLFCRSLILFHFWCIVDFSLLGIKLLLCFCTNSGDIYFSNYKTHLTKMLLNGISSDRRPLELAVPKMLISPTRIKYCTILSSLHKEFEILVFEEMQLLCVCTKQGTKKILFLSSNSTLCGSCVRRIADTRLREKRQVLFVANMLLCCSHTFEFANTSWPTIAFFRVKAADAK